MNLYKFSPAFSVTKALLAMLLAAALAVFLGSCGKKGGADDTDTGSGTENTAPTKNSGTESVPVTDEATDKKETTASGTGTEPPETETEPSKDVMSTPEKTLKYTALGDSIAFGYGLLSPETERYSALLDTYIDALTGYEAESYNYGINGQTSSELLAALTNDPAFAPELNGADIVTVSIGANNVLSPAISMFMQYAINSLIEDEAQQRAANKLLYEAFNKEAAAGVATFAEEMPDIIAAIKARAPEAKIFFETVYNPYNNVSLKLPVGDAVMDLNEASDELVGKLNAIITANADTLGYTVADVYTALENETGVVNAESFTEGGGILNYAALDPHPTAKGHAIIAGTFRDVLGIG